MSFCSSARGGRAEGRERRQVVDVAGDGGALVQRRVRVRPAPGRVGRRRQVGPHGAGRVDGRAVGRGVEALVAAGARAHGPHARAAPAALAALAALLAGTLLVGGRERRRHGRAGRRAGRRAERRTRWLPGDLRRLVDIAHHLLELGRALGLLLVVQGDLLGELSRRRHPGGVRGAALGSWRPRRSLWAEALR